jgi:hypothetical protein
MISASILCVGTSLVRTVYLKIAVPGRVRWLEAPRLAAGIAQSVSPTDAADPDFNFHPGRQFQACLSTAVESSPPSPSHASILSCHVGNGGCMARLSSVKTWCWHPGKSCYMIKDLPACHIVPGIKLISSKCVLPEVPTITAVCAKTQPPFQRCAIIVPTYADCHACLPLSTRPRNCTSETSPCNRSSLPWLHRLPLSFTISSVFCH